MSGTSLRVSKLHGAGNDFLVTVGTTDRGPGADVAVRLLLEVIHRRGHRAH